MRHARARLFTMTTLLALLALAACAQPPSNAPAPTMRDDTRTTDHPDRGMRDSHMM
jgi:hypothetical protein